MDSIFEKFGIYDFVGIWIPGALTVTYYLFTLSSLFTKALKSFGIQKIAISKDFLIVILYTAVAFFVGIVLHEIGKILADIVPWFCLSDINTRMYKKDIQKRPVLLLKRIRYEYQQAHKKNDIVKNNQVVDFDKAISSLKYNEKVNTKRIDKYHSIYALSRSLFLCFLIHAIIICFYWNLFLFITDLFLMLLFFVRTYRYFYSWVKDVYLQYYKTIGVNSK